VDDDVGGIDEDPVGGPPAFDADTAVSGGLDRRQHLFGDGRDMAVRAAAGDDHGVGNRRFASKINDNGVFRFGVVTGFENKFAKGVHRVLSCKGGVGCGAAVLGAVGANGCQNNLPFIPDGAFPAYYPATSRAG